MKSVCFGYGWVTGLLSVSDSEHLGVCAWFMLPPCHRKQTKMELEWNLYLVRESLSLQMENTSRNHLVIS